MFAKRVFTELFWNKLAHNIDSNTFLSEKKSDYILIKIRLFQHDKCRQQLLYLEKQCNLEKI